jgi:hypothetical protein
MKNKNPFGYTYSKKFSNGDQVFWNRWSDDKKMWEKKYGIIIKTINEMRMNRLVSISLVYSNEDGEIKKFFTLSLYKVGDDRTLDRSYRDIGE